MSTDWKKIKFGDCAEKVSNAVQPDKIDPAVPYIGLEHIIENGLQISGHSVAAEATSTKTRFSQGDILFGKLRPYFRKVVRPNFDGICSTDIWAIKAKKGIDQRFLFYRMASQEFIDKSMGASTGTRMPRADWGYLSTWEIPIPPIYQQRKIASILGAFDDKIAVNQRINATLEAMARALFQSWFVDFDPVREKLDGKNPKFLDEATAKLFPNAFQESELGHIPKGWRAGTLSEGFNITMGQSPPGNTYNELGDGLPFYQGCTDFGFRFPKRRIYCTAPNRTAKVRDTLVSVRAPVGDINMAKEDCCIGRGVAAVRHKSGASSFTYYAIANLYPDFAKFEAEGTVFGSINKDSFEKLPFVIPPASIVSAFERLAEPLDEQIRILVEQSHTLANIRDALLPKLLNGELSVENLHS